MKQLRASYDNEVKQVEQVEANLATAKEETEALRSEASIAEAKLTPCRVSYMKNKSLWKVCRKKIVL